MVPAPLRAEVAAILAPIRAALDVQEARINEIDVQRQSLVVRAPISGTIAAIYLWPGQVVLAGMPVDVRIANLGHKTFATTIGRVGAQVELIPLVQLRDPKMPEWGLPVQILVPEALNARPGTRVDVTYDWSKIE